MKNDHVLKGKSILLRSVNVNDAKFILQLRLDDKKNKFLNKVNNSLTEQEKWIKNQRNRKNDYYFIIEQLDGQRVGTIGLYDIDFEKGTFNWGRWIIIDNALPTTIIESSYLIYNFGFLILNLSRAMSDVRLGNFKVINFHISYGAKIYKIDSKNAYYIFDKEQFNNFINKYKRFIN